MPENQQNRLDLYCHPLVKVPLAELEVLIQILLLSECWSFFTPKDKQSFDIDAWHCFFICMKGSNHYAIVGLHFVDVRFTFTYLWTSDNISPGPL